MGPASARFFGYDIPSVNGFGIPRAWISTRQRWFPALSARTAGLSAIEGVVDLGGIRFLGYLVHRDVTVVRSAEREVEHFWPSLYTATAHLVARPNDFDRLNCGSA